MAIQVSLPAELEHKVYDEVKTGKYNNASEVVSEALRLYFTRPSSDEVLSYFLKPRIDSLHNGTAEIDEFSEEDLARERQEIFRELENDAFRINK